MTQQLPNHIIDTGQCDLLALGEDIEDLVAYISPAKRNEVVQALVHRLQHIVDDIWNTSDKLSVISQPVQLRVYGSSFTGLDLPASDVDLTLLHVINAEKQLNKDHAVPAVRALWSDAHEYIAPLRDAIDEWDNHCDESCDDAEQYDTVSDPPLVVNQQVLYERQISVLHQLEHEITQRGWALNCQLIRARVPIIKLQDRELGFHLDVSVEQHDGLTSSEDIKRALHDNPLLTPVIKTLKLTLHSRDLHRPYTGGVGSYLLVLLVLHYFKLHGQHVIDQPHESEDVKQESENTTRTHLARALLGVLQWYGETLAPLSWTLHSDTGHVELHTKQTLTDDIDETDAVQCVLHPITKHNVAASATALPTVFAHWAQLARDLRGGKALDQVVWCSHVIGSYIDKLARVTQFIGQKRSRDDTTEDDHVIKRAKTDSE